MTAKVRVGQLVAFTALRDPRQWRNRELAAVTSGLPPRSLPGGLGDCPPGHPSTGQPAGRSQLDQLRAGGELRLCTVSFRG
jgi:hypothetical protein